MDIHYTKDLQEMFIKAPALKNCIEYALWFFPEIESIKFGRASRRAYYDARTGTVRLTRSSSVYVIGHEATHFLQDERHFNGKTLPKGERQCDLFLFARSPALVADFWKSDYQRRQFARWAHDSYNPGISRLVGEWVRIMREEGKVLRMYPFMSVMRSLLLNEKTLLRCGAGWAEFNVQTDGKISPCPVMSDMKAYYAGDILNGNPLHLKQTLISGPCNGCEVLDICGGRCLYANVTGKWGDKGFAEVCSTIKNLIRELQGASPEVRQLIKEGKIGLEDFEHTKFNSCEIIP